MNVLGHSSVSGTEEIQDVQDHEILQDLALFFYFRNVGYILTKIVHMPTSGCVLIVE